MIFPNFFQNRYFFQIFHNRYFSSIFLKLDVFPDIFSKQIFFQIFLKIDVFPDTFQNKCFSRIFFKTNILKLKIHLTKQKSIVKIQNQYVPKPFFVLNEVFLSLAKLFSLLPNLETNPFLSLKSIAACFAE